MKVVQVLSFVSADGAYGGPVAVARMQCEHLAKLGHEVHLVAGWDGVAQLEIPGVLVHLFRARRLPGLGFAGLVSPGVWRAVAAIGSGADVVHMHVARDLVQLPSAAVIRGRTPLVLQAHGMIRPDRRVSARVVDLLGTRPTYRAARTHLVLTEVERSEVTEVEARAAGRIVSIRNAVGVADLTASWSADAPRVVYVARLHARKRPATFVGMASEAVARGSRAVFDLYGSDEGELGPVLRRIADLGLGDRIRYRGPLSPADVIAVMADAQVFVLPSVDEPFPMAVLEAMSVGLPPVITTETGISRELRDRGAATVTDGSATEMADAVLSLTASREAWEAASRAARADIAASFSCETVAAALQTVYEDAVAAGRPKASPRSGRTRHVS